MMRYPVLLLTTLVFVAGCGRNSEPTQEPTPAQQEDGVQALPAQPIRTPLRLIAAGIWRPLFPGKDDDKEVPVAAFHLESHAVTNAQFLAFVKAQPQWRRSQIKGLFAEPNYLKHWLSDLQIPQDTDQSPVTHVSWFAARAYAEWIGRRLPTLAQWEYAATSGADQESDQRILDWYAEPTPTIPAAVKSKQCNSWGVYDMHGLIWEWLEDFNSALVTGESRGDSGLDRQLFCGSGSVGAADPSDYAAFMRFGFRSSLQASYTIQNLGFRCATSAEQE